jgi:uncharacterized protein YpmS
MRRLSANGPSIQVAIRFTPEEMERLRTKVSLINKSAEKLGLPVNASVSGLVRLWVKKQLDEPEWHEEDVPQEASHINAALEKLRAAR